jgi:hypothetical protein
MKANARRVAPTPAFGEVRDQLRAEAIRDGAPALLQAALAPLTVEEYNLNGKKVMLEGASPSATDSQ